MADDQQQSDGDNGLQKPRNESAASSDGGAASFYSSNPPLENEQSGSGAAGRPKKPKTEAQKERERARRRRRRQRKSEVIKPELQMPSSAAEPLPEPIMRNELAAPVESVMLVEPEAELQLGPEAELQLGPEAELQLGSEAELQLGPEAELQPGSELSSEPQPEVQPMLETEPGFIPESHAVELESVYPDPEIPVGPEIREVAGSGYADVGHSTYWGDSVLSNSEAEQSGQTPPTVLPPAFDDGEQWSKVQVGQPQQEDVAADSVPQPTFESETETGFQPKSAVQPEPEVQPTPEPEIEPEYQYSPEPYHAPELEPEAESQLKPEPEVEPEPESESEPEPESELQPEPGSQPEPEVQAKEGEVVEPEISEEEQKPEYLDEKTEGTGIKALDFVKKGLDAVRGLTDKLKERFAQTAAKEKPAVEAEVKSAGGRLGDLFQKLKNGVAGIFSSGIGGWVRKVLGGMVVIILVVAVYFFASSLRIYENITNLFKPKTPVNVVVNVDPQALREQGIATAYIFADNMGSFADRTANVVKNAYYFGRLEQPVFYGQTGISAAVHYGFLRDQQAAKNQFAGYIQILRQLNSLYQVDVYELVDRSPNRNESLTQYLNELNATQVQGTQNLQSIQAQIDDLKISSNSLDPDKARYQTDFFVALENLGADQANFLLQNFIEVSQKQVALKAQLSALTRLAEYYQSSLINVRLRIQAVEANRAAVLAGIRAVSVPGSNLGVVVPST